MIQDLELEINGQISLTDVVFKNLRWAILKGDLMPGERLREVPLAKQFRVSRTPVREAIRKLELEGLAFMMPKCGAKVAKIEEKDLRDVLEVRILLEKIAIELACERISIEWLMKFETVLENFYHAADSRDIIKIIETDICFHEMIFETTQNFQMIQVMNNFIEHTYRYRLEYLKELPNYMQLYKEHCDIYEAIKRKDKESAQELMNDHIYSQEQALIKTYSDKSTTSY